MPNMRGRSAYNPIAAADDSEDLEEQLETSVVPPNSSTVDSSAITDAVADADAMSRTLALGRRRTNGTNSGLGSTGYAPVDQLEKEDTSPEKDTIDDDDSLSTSKNKKNASLVDTMEEDDDDESKDSGKRIQVIVLDAAQKRFLISVNPEWTVQRFKKVGAKIHKVLPPSQRLILRGRMLEDSKTLKEMGVNQEDVIIHLFPKPRVVVTSSASGVTDSSNNSDVQEEGGAHVPQIILDEAEQERRGQILVLGSYEIAEAQNNVRLLSLLLGVICIMRLLTLLGIASGTDEVPVHTDDTTPAPGGNSTDDGMYPHVDYEQRTWETQDYFDLVVSTVGLFVARLGMKAASENTSRLATRYLVGTMIAGILWNIWNVFEFVVFIKGERAPKDDETMVPLTNDDFRTIALFTVMMPLGVWCLCCGRALQFRHLIEEAEQEAAERIRSELTLVEGQDTEESNPSNENAPALDQTSSTDDDDDRRTIV